MCGNDSNEWSALHMIVVAAGVGTRFGASMPKQYQMLGGRPLLMTTIERLRRVAPGAAMTVVVSREMEAFWRELCERHGFVSPQIAYGGATRAESVRNALATVSPDVRYVAVHDGVRPLVTAEVLADALRAVKTGADGAIPAVAVTDSLREVDADGGSRPVDRTRYRAVQTPQMFRADRLREAYSRELRPEFTDDASVMSAAGYADIRLTAGSPYNIKLTHPLDLLILEALTRSGDPC